MTKKILTTIAVIVLTTTLSFAQNKTYIGASVGITSDIYELVDNGSGLKKASFVNGLWGLELRQELNNRIFLETGLIRKYYNEGVAFKIAGGHGATHAIEAWWIPLRWGTKINLHKEKVFLVPVIGYSFCINSDYDSGKAGSSGGVQISGGDSARYEATAAYNLTQTFPLLQTGVSFEFKLRHTALLSFSANYYTGFKQVIRQDIRYTINNETEQTAVIFSKGENLCFDLSLKYPVSNFWVKTK